MPAGKVKTVTAPPAQTPACPASACCAAAAAAVSVGFVSALSLEPTELPVKSAPPVQTPAQSKSKPSFSLQLITIFLKSLQAAVHHCSIKEVLPSTLITNDSHWLHMHQRKVRFLSELNQTLNQLSCLFLHIDLPLTLHVNQ